MCLLANLGCYLTLTEVDVLFSSIQYELISLPDRQVLGRGIDEMADPLLSGLSAGGNVQNTYYTPGNHYPSFATTSILLL